jgi:hypothetical protein
MADDYMDEHIYQGVDYHDFTDINTPKEKRRELGVGDVYINAVKCLHCGDTPRSKNRHHMAYCKCGKTAVDGGSWYGKITGDLAMIENASVLYADVEIEVEEEKPITYHI